MTIPDDAVERIVEAHAPDATTADEIREAVSGADAAQARGAAAVVGEAALTEEDVLQELRQGNRVPSEGQLGSIVSGTDGVTVSEQRMQEVEASISEQVLTREEVETAVQEAVEAGESQRGYPTREDVERGIDSVRDGDVTGSVDDMTTDLARDAGAPAQSEIQAEAARIVAQSDSTEVTETLTAETIRDTNGEPVAVVGRQSEAQQAAEELGVDALGAQEVSDSLGVRGTGSRVDLTLKGRKVGEVDV